MPRVEMMRRLLADPVVGHALASDGELDPPLAHLALTGFGVLDVGGVPARTSTVAPVAALVQLSSGVLKTRTIEMVTTLGRSD